MKTKVPNQAPYRSRENTAKTEPDGAGSIYRRKVLVGHDALKIKNGSPKFLFHMETTMDDKKSVTDVIQELSWLLTMYQMFILERDLIPDFTEFINEKNIQFHAFRNI